MKLKQCSEISGYILQSDRQVSGTMCKLNSAILIASINMHGHTRINIGRTLRMYTVPF